MKNRNLRRAAIAVLALAALQFPTIVWGQSPAETIIEWNQITQTYTVGAPFVHARNYAIVQVAMADAVVAVRGKYAPFHAHVSGPPDANAPAAAAQAAHDVLVWLIPTNTADFDAALVESLESIPPDKRYPGRSIGKKVAEQIIAWRQSDGFADASPQPPTISPSLLPGIWRETGSGPALYSAYEIVPPFALPSPTMFLPAPPPQLDSNVYANNFNKVKDIGRLDSATRTPRQTRIATSIAGAPPYANVTNPIRVWQNVAADVARTQDLSILDTARLFALMSVSINDSLQTSQVSKFVYRLWRPVTAVQNADIDQNDATDADASWLPLLTTPPYPSHSSNASCVGTGAGRMLANVLGTDQIPFVVKWYSDNTMTTVVSSEPYGTFSGFARDMGSSRIWGGIHYRFEIDTSEHSCTQIADYIYDHYLTPK